MVEGGTESNNRGATVGAVELQWRWNNGTPNGNFLWQDECMAANHLWQTHDCAGEVHGFRKLRMAGSSHKFCPIKAAVLDVITVVPCTTITAASGGFPSHTPSKKLFEKPRQRGIDGIISLSDRKNREWVPGRWKQLAAELKHVGLHRRGRHAHFHCPKKTLWLRRV